MHIAGAIWAVYWMGPFHAVRFSFMGPVREPLAIALSVLAVAWAVSAYNFMDGIDSLAASEAVFVGAIGGLFALQSGGRDVAFISFLIAASSLGFLHWNLPRAKVFLGDVGSGFLGYAFAIVALFSDRTASLPAIGWWVLLGVFAFDSTVTLCRRLVRREAWHVTHRESAYQRAALRFRGHGRVTLFIMAVNVMLAALCWIGWMIPMLWASVLLFSSGMLGLLYWRVEKWAPVVHT